MKCASFFSGAGGLDYGFYHHGFDIILSNDINKNACKTHYLNYKTNIRKCSINDIPYEDYNKAEIIIGGPPCQGFSINGKMDINDKRNLLIKDYLNLILSVKPKIFLTENVPALLELDKWSVIRDSLIQNMSKEYFIFKKVLLCNEYGIPQSRKRAIIIGFNKKYFNESVINTYEKYLNSYKEDRVINAIDILKIIGPISSSNNNDCNAKITLCKKPVLRKDPYGGFLFNGQGRVVNPNKPIPTIIASCGGCHTPIIDEEECYFSGSSFIIDYHKHLMNGGSVLTQTPNRLRRLTIREAKYFQTFADDFKFYGSKTSIYKQIGNAVPPKLSIILAKSILDII